MSSYREIDVRKENAHLAFVLSQMLGFPKRRELNGQPSRCSGDDVPDTFAKLYGNLEALGDWILQANSAAEQKLFVRKFFVYPNLDTKRVLKEANNIHNIEGFPFEVARFVDGGEVLFFATAPIPQSAKSKGCNIEFGFDLVLERGNLVSLYLYSAFHASSHRDPVGYEFQLCNRFKEASIKTVLRSVLSKSKAAAEKELSGWHRTAIKQFNLPQAV